MEATPELKAKIKTDKEYKIIKEQFMTALDIAKGFARCENYTVGQMNKIIAILAEEPKETHE